MLIAPCFSSSHFPSYPSSLDAYPLECVISTSLFISHTLNLISYAISWRYSITCSLSEGHARALVGSWRSAHSTLWDAVRKRGRDANESWRVVTGRCDEMQPERHYGSSQETKMKTKNWERNWDVISDSESESDVSTEITVSSKPKALALNTTVTPYLGTELSKHFDADNFDLHVYSLTCNAQNLVNNIWSSVDHVCKTVPFNGISPEPRHDYSDNVSAQAEVFRRRSTSHSSEHSSFTPSHLS
eukprot:747626-Hanusia_phi.AAC.2